VSEQRATEFVIVILAGLVVFALGMLIFIKYAEKH